MRLISDTIQMLQLKNEQYLLNSQFFNKSLSPANPFSFNNNKLIDMFNNYIAKKRELNLYKRIEESKNQTEWKTKYHQHIQPHLLQNYKHRINSFMYQMDENPIYLEEEPRYNPEKDSRCGFIFKNCEDWRSLQTISERLYFQITSKNYHKNSQTSQRRFNLSSSSSNPMQYRIRDKTKQINKPMRFGKMMSQSIEPQRRRHHSLRPTRQQAKKEDSIETDIDNISLSLKEVTSKESDANSDFLQNKGRIDNIEIDREEEQRRNGVKQTKRHFKKLMTLSLLGEQRNKKEIKMILDKCRYIKKKGNSNSESLEIDHFARIVEKIRQK